MPKPIISLILSVTCLFFVSCVGQQEARSPKGYDFSNPVKYDMPDDLTEISGIAFNKGNPDTLFVEQDEDGKLFYFKPGSKDVPAIKFGKSGDYEDLAIISNQVVMLRSDGVLFTFPLDVKNAKPAVKELDSLLPKGEYEGLFADDASQLIYALCKRCAMEKSSKTNTIFSFKLSADGALQSDGKFIIDVKKIEELTGTKKITFHPSALSKNRQTGEWYILSSVNKLLVVADPNWVVKAVYTLNPRTFHQPEGMTFDNSNNLYISNEGDKVQPGNVLKFELTK
ncbi:SdiA-regulated domain-containing protein [Mucilaginibacter xinganensis]|nr:SdiA-regulated domain-containing protein [Mucilaginibacter xinganensis]